MEEWSGSSIDGSLDDGGEFDTSNVVVTDVVEIENHFVEEHIEYFGRNSDTHDSGGRDDIREAHSSSIGSGSEDYAEMLIPSCKKLSHMLHQSGYSPIDLTSSDIDINRRSVSVFIIDAWAESVCVCLAELLDHQRSAQANASAVSLDVGRADARQTALETELSQTQEKLDAAVRREKAAVQKKENAGSYHGSTLAWR